MANANNPLSFHTREELEGDGDGGEHMPPEIVIRALRSGPRLPLPSGCHAHECIPGNSLLVLIFQERCRQTREGYYCFLALAASA
jgi:hypothetical protein